MYWVVQEICSGFSVRWYRKAQRNDLGNPVFPYSFFFFLIIIILSLSPPALNLHFPDPVSQSVNNLCLLLKYS